MLFLLFAIVSLPFVLSQTCSDAGIGLCVGDICPTGYTCLDRKLSTETCCDDTKIVAATTAPPTTTAAPTTAAPSNCVDLLNPATGVSDCPQRTNLCQDSTYYDLMTQQCPKTCGRCTGGGGNTGGTGTGGTGSACVDKLNPKTGVSDCPQRTAYCSNQVYFDLMTDQCPQTCGRCSIAAGQNTGGTSGGCVDKLNPKTGQSDCPSMASYCSNQVLMTEQCAKTCDRCTTSSGSSSSSGTSGTSGTSGSGGCVDKVNPSTGISDCSQRVQYCNDQTYYSLMTDQCPQTCGRCNG